jgi:hypothetical protein
MVSALVSLIVWLLVIGIIYAIFDYVLVNLIPDPPQKIIRVVVIVVLALVVVLLLLQLIGQGGFTMPKLG